MNLAPAPRAARLPPPNVQGANLSTTVTGIARKRTGSCTRQAAKCSHIRLEKSFPTFLY